jgi:hypothetical protein
MMAPKDPSKAFNDAQMLLERKKRRAWLMERLKIPYSIARPIAGIQESEINYVGFTALTILSNPNVNQVKLSPQMAGMVVPVLWGYLDGACAMVVGMEQLLNEDDYRQTQLKIKGMLNIFSGMQLFALSYNPALVAALGITGGPAALAGGAFALSTLVDVITTSIDYCNACKEQNIEGWFDERIKEYTFICKKITTLEKELEALQLLPEEDNLFINDIQKELQALRLRQTCIKNDVQCRWKVNQNTITSASKDELKKVFEQPLNMGEITAAERVRDHEIQSALNKSLVNAKTQLAIKVASFVGIALLAVATFALVTTCPPQVVLLGLAITTVVAAAYLSNHQKNIRQQLDTLRHHSKEEDSNLQASKLDKDGDEKGDDKKVPHT